MQGLFLRNTMSLKSAIALIVCFILFSEKKHHRALVFLLPCWLRPWKFCLFV
jgi:hypothetical protein